MGFWGKMKLNKWFQVGHLKFWSNCWIMRIETVGKLDKIKHFSRTYAELGKCVESINKFFDIPLMVKIFQTNFLQYKMLFQFILLSCFIHLIITIWGILVCYYTWWFFLFMNIVWIIIQGGRLIFVVEPIHSCLFEVNTTKGIL